MKKTVRIASLILLLILLATQTVLASGLKITAISPEDGEKGKQISNMAVKLTFSEVMADKNAAEKNAALFRITGPEDKEIPFQVVFSEEKYPNQLWLILEGELVSNSEYKVEILPGVVSKSGAVLADGMTTTFRTRNTKTDSTVSMVMMFGMMAVMFLASNKQAKKAAEEKGENIDADKQYNPYKLAKDKGISVDEAKALIEKEKEKDARRAQKYAENKKQKDDAMAAEVEAIQKRLEEEYEAARHAKNYQVARLASIKAAGAALPRSVVKQNKAARAAAAKEKKK